MLSSIFSFLTFVSVVVGRPTATAPGLKMLLSQDLLNTVNEAVPSVLDSVVKNVQIPDITGQFHVNVVGTFSYDISEIHLLSITVSSSSTKIATNGIAETVNNANIHLTVEYHWKHISGLLHYSDHGSVDVMIEGVSISFTTAVGEANGRPTVHTDSVSFTIGGQTSFTFHGKISWIYNDLEKYFKGDILGAVNKAVPTAVEKAINDKAEAALAKLQVVVPWKNLLMDYSLLAPPTLQAGKMLSFGLNGDWELKANPKPCPFPRDQLPGSLSNHQVQFFVGDFYLDCAGRALYEGGNLTVGLQAKDVSASAQKYFNTSTYKDVIPGLYKQYPNDLLAMRVYSTGAPDVTVSPAGIRADAPTNINVSAVVGTQQRPAFTLANGLTLNVSTSISNNTVYATVNDVMCNISLVSSQVGKIELTVLGFLVKEACKYAVPAAFNKFLGDKGFHIPDFPIPEWGTIDLVQPQVILGKNYLGLATSAKFVPPSIPVDPLPPQADDPDPSLFK